MEGSVPRHVDDVRPLQKRYHNRGQGRGDTSGQHKTAEERDGHEAGSRLRRARALHLNRRPHWPATAMTDPAALAVHGSKWTSVVRSRKQDPIMNPAPATMMNGMTRVDAHGQNRHVTHHAVI